MSKLNDKAKELIDKNAFANIATLMKDGSPQVTPVWIEYEGDDLYINTAEGRLKAKNLRRDPRVAISLSDPDDPYTMVTIRGRAAEITDEGAEEHIDALAKKYLDADTYPNRTEGEVRLKVRIEPDKVGARQ
jgi:PPOX class probable F420-dependent enzyme